MCSLVVCRCLIVVHSCCSLSLHWCVLLVLINVSTCYVACSCCSSTLPCYTFLLLIRVSLLCYFDVHWRFFTMHSCCSSMYCCYALLLFIGILLLCTFIICWHLLDVHSSCLSTPPCYTPFYSSMLQVYVDPQCFSSAPCCVLLLFVSTSLLCAHVTHWHLLAMRSWCAFYTSLLCTPIARWHLLVVCSWCSLVLFKLVFHFCIFLCRCGKNNFQLLLQLQKYFSSFKKKSIAYFFEVFFFFIFSIFCCPNLLSKMCLQFIF